MVLCPVPAVRSLNKGHSLNINNLLTPQIKFTPGWYSTLQIILGEVPTIYNSTVATVDVSFPIILNPTSVINPNDMNGMTSRPRRPHTTGGEVFFSSTGIEALNTFSK